MSIPGWMSLRRLSPVILFSGLLAGWLAALVLVSGQIDAVTERQLSRANAAQQLLTNVLDQESGVRAYLGSGQESLLTPFNQSSGRFDDLLAAELADTDDPELRAGLLRQRALGLAWRRLANEDVNRFEIDDRLYRRSLLEREEQLTAFRRENARYQLALSSERDEAANALMLRAIALVTGVSVLLGGAALVTMRRRMASERDYAAAQAEFAVAMQSAVDGTEADALLKRHLERQLGGVTVTVLRRDASGERLEAGTPTPPGTPLATALADAKPRDCLAIRRSGMHERDGDDALVSCEVCGASGPTTCRPLLMGDRIIGSVLVEYADSRRRGADERAIGDSLAQAAPVLSGLRTLALAQSRAMTDALTGLPNRWALQDALKRMLAHASRTERPLALVLLDLDHFKHLNDTYGHDAGDQALAAVGQALRGALRESDLATRSGGEEFTVLLPDTPLEGALQVAEQLRTAVSSIELPLPGVALSASLGVAVLPLHAVEADRLIRVADRALYAAKRAGRNRVEIAEAPAEAREQRALPASTT